MKLKIREQAFINSLLAFIYIILIVLFMNNGAKLFGEDDRGILAPIGILSLLVLSATVMGILIFGKPIMFFIDGNKKDAIKLTTYTIIGFFIITVIYFAFMIIIK